MNIFQQKYPCNVTWQGRFRTALFFGVFIVVFLLVFKPFGLDTLPGDKMIFVCSAYSFAVFVCILAVGLILPVIFPSFFDEEKWTTGKQIIIITGTLILIGVVNYLIAPLLIGPGLSFRRFLWYEGITVSIGILPITIYTLLEQNSLLKKFQKQASELEKKLQEKLNPDKKEEQPSPPDEKKNELTVIELKGDYQGEKLVLLPEELYFISAANNYVKVYYFKNNKVTYSILRTTMKKVEEVLQLWPGFFRCHRAYIINLDKVQHVEGNAQGYRVRMQGIDEAIPVSRNLNNEFSDRLLAHRNNTR